MSILAYPSKKGTMKSRLLPAILLILSIQFLHAQQVMSKDQFATLIVGKWKVTEARIGDIKMPVSEIGEITMLFKSDATYVMRDQSELHKGKWSFNPATQELLTDDGEEKEKHKVIKLNKTLLTTETKSAKETETMTFVRF